MGDVTSINVKRGTQKPRSICITLIGGAQVDTIWALNATTLRIPLYTGWRVDIAKDFDTAVERWRASDKPTEWLLAWPEGTFLRWDTIEEICKSSDLIVKIGAAEAIRVTSNDSSPVVLRPDLEVSQAEAMPPREARAEENSAACMAICIPSRGTVSRVWMANLMQVAVPMGVSATIHVALGMPVDEARCHLATEVLAMNPTPKYMLFLGDDNLPPPRGIAQLHDVLEAADNLKAVGGLYRLKQDPPSIVAWRSSGCVVKGRDFEEGQVIGVDGMGLDFCLMRTETLKLVPDPRFMTVETKTVSQTEDSYFWNKWRVATDTRPYLHTGCVVGHYDAATGQLY